MHDPDIFQWITDEARDAMLAEVVQSQHNPFSIYVEDFTGLTPCFGVDQPFRNYTPFPKLDAAERKVRAAATEGRERLVAAWKVLRSGDREPFHEGCDHCGW